MLPMLRAAGRARASAGRSWAASSLTSGVPVSGRALTQKCQPVASSTRVLMKPSRVNPSLLLKTRVSSPSLRCGSTLTLPTSDTEKPPEGAATESAIPPGHSVAHLYFDSIFPLTQGLLDPRAYLSALQGDAPLHSLKSVLPEQEKIGFGFKILGVESREKDGGAFLTFAYRPEHSASFEARQLSHSVPKGTALSSDEAVTLSVINARIRPHLQPIHQFAFSPTRLLPARFLPKPSAHIVLGTPWLEDLARYPSRAITISFLEGGAPSEQQLWEMLRPFGKVMQLEINTKENKATAVFHRMRSAAAARNCLYGASLQGRKLAIDYIPPGHAKKLWEWLTSHPRIVLPVLAFFLGTLTYAVFDPIRAFFIKSNVQGIFELQDYPWYAWLRRNTVGLFDSGSKDNGGVSIDDWWERKAAVSEIQSWLREPPSTFITIAGPRGSGKHSLLDRALHDKHIKHLTISCEEIAHTAKNEEGAIVPAVASEVGYFPVFSWISSLNNLIDLAAVGLIGSKAGFSTPTDAQLKQVLNVTTGALASIKEETIRKKEKEAKKAAKKEGKAKGSVAGVTTPTPALSTETGPAPVSSQPTEKDPEASVAGTDPDSDSKGNMSPKESRDELGTDAKLLATEGITADERGYDAPVVVLDGFHHKGLQSEVLWNVMAAWAADVTTSGTAHVVFVTDNPVAMAKTLGRALPNIPFESVVLADADEDKAREYVATKLKELGKAQTPSITKSVPAGTQETSSPETKSGLSALLGSSAPQSPPPAADTADIPALDSALDNATAKWVDLLGGRLTDLEALVQKVALGHTVETAVKDIIARTVVEVRKNAFGDDSEDAKSLPWIRAQAWVIVEKLASHAELPYYALLHDSFKGDEAALKAMEQAELISVRHVDARPSMIRAGRPVVLQALRALVDDRVFADTQRLLSNTASIASAEKDIRAAEAEMRELGECIMAAGTVAKSNQATRDRFEHLLGVLGANQNKIRKLEEANAGISKSLAENGER